MNTKERMKAKDYAFCTVLVLAMILFAVYVIATHPKMFGM